jgi:hypothetical protein
MLLFLKTLENTTTQQGGCNGEMGVISDFYGHVFRSGVFEGEKNGYAG